MEITSVTLARSIAFLELGDLDRHGSLFLPHLVGILRDRFQFQKAPLSLEDFDVSKGVAFNYGYFEGHVIDNLTLYEDGIKIDLRTSTADGQRIIQETLGWLKEKHQVTYEPGMLRRWGFVSNVVFKAEFDLDSLSPSLDPLRQNLSRQMTSKTGGRSYRVSGIHLDFDRAGINAPISRFTIERRAQASFDERRYFSASPFTTAEHVRALEDFEHSMIATLSAT